MSNDEPLALTRQTSHHFASTLEKGARRSVPLVYEALIHVYDDIGSSLLLLVPLIVLSSECMTAGFALRS